MKANHNCTNVTLFFKFVVFQYVKDTIWKQITTLIIRHPRRNLLFFNTSKIQFESKSQLLERLASFAFGCFSIRQRYNLKANHNSLSLLLKLSIVVFQYVKDTIWKQITTLTCASSPALMLFFNTSKIQFESKSQPPCKAMKELTRCFSIRQRYNLKANHNSSSGGEGCSCVVFQYVKDTIWKQITTLLIPSMLEGSLFFNTSKIQFESKSQQQIIFGFGLGSCFSIRQRYNLKANHNLEQAMAAVSGVVFQYVKDTIWKQITTKGASRKRMKPLFFNTSKIQFESKSQH